MVFSSVPVYLDPPNWPNQVRVRTQIARISSSAKKLAILEKKSRKEKMMDRYLGGSEGIDMGFIFIFNNILELFYLLF